jgi:hypothetical protein
MTGPAFHDWGPPALLAVLAVLVLARAWRWFRNRHRGPISVRFIPVKGADRMMTLEAAANSALETGTRERLAMLSMANQRNTLTDPTAWLAASIAGVVPVYRRQDDGSFAVVDKAEIAALGAPSLYILKRDLQTYMRWARTVQ